MAKKKTSEATEAATADVPATATTPEAPEAAYTTQPPVSAAEIVRKACEALKAAGEPVGKPTVWKYLTERNSGAELERLKKGLSQNINNAKKKLNILKEREASPKQQTTTTTNNVNKYAGIEDDLPRLKELAEQYGADELLSLAEELPALVAKFGSSFKPILMFAAK